MCSTRVQFVTMTLSYRSKLTKFSGSPKHASHIVPLFLPNTTGYSHGSFVSLPRPGGQHSLLRPVHVLRAHSMPFRLHGLLTSHIWNAALILSMTVFCVGVVVQLKGKEWMRSMRSKRREPGQPKAFEGEKVEQGAFIKLYQRALNHSLSNSDASCHIFLISKPWPGVLN